MKLANEHLQTLGQVALRYTELDFTVTAFVGRLLCPDDRAGLAVGRFLSLRTKLELLGALFALLPDVTREPELRLLVEAAHRAEEGRNRVMHATVWGTLKDPEHGLKPAIFRTRRKNGAFNAERMTVEDVTAIAGRGDAGKICRRTPAVFISVQHARPL